MANAMALYADEKTMNASLSLSSYSWSWGPITVSVDVDLSSMQLSISVTLLGVSIGQLVLNSSNPSATIGGTVLGQTAEITFTVDFSARTLTIAGKLETFFGTKDFSTVIQF